jgi:hypothetical protein
VLIPNRIALLAVFGGTLGGCAIMPDLPPDWALPQSEVIHHSACEIQTALRFFDRYPPPKSVFVARNWTIRLSLNPKVDADIVPGAGLTRRQPTKSTATRFANLVVGSGNGITAELRGDRTGNLDFVFDSAKLIDDDSLDCANEPFSLHSLTKSIGIGEWLTNSINAAVLTHSSIDKPSFSTEVYTKYSGAGSYTYTFPAGTDLGSLSGYYQLDETLNINFAAKTPSVKISAKTLPPGGPGFGPNAPTGAVVSTVQVLQEQRSDLQQIEQAIRNLRVNTQ